MKIIAILFILLSFAVYANAHSTYTHNHEVSNSQHADMDSNHNGVTVRAGRGDGRYVSHSHTLNAHEHSTGEISFSWLSVSGAVKYHVCTQWGHQSDTTSTSFSFSTGAGLDTTMGWEVTAYDSNGNSLGTQSGTARVVTASTDTGGNNGNSQTPPNIQEEGENPPNQGSPPRPHHSGNGGDSEPAADTVQTDDVHAPAATRTATSVHAGTVRSTHGAVKCPPSKGYAIEFNDKDQIRIVAPEKRSAHLYLWFDDQETTIFAVIIGYVSPKSLSADAWNTWIDISTLQIVDYRQPNAKCLPCQNVAFSDARRMELKVSTGGYLCSVAVYPESAPASPSLVKPKLATLWATLKR